MSRCEMHASTFNRAGFYLPLAGHNIDLDEKAYLAMAAQYDYVPLCAERSLQELVGHAHQDLSLAADLSMAHLYQALHCEAPSCFLESLTGNDNGRYSIIANKALQTISTSQLNPQGVAPLRSLIDSIHVPQLDLPFFSGGLVGFWSYETGLFYHNLPANQGDFFEQAFFMPGEVLVYDRHLKILTIILWTERSGDSQQAYPKACHRVEELLTLASQCYLEEEPLTVPRDISFSPEDFETNIGSEEFCKLVVEAQEHINQGDIFQVVLSRRWKNKSSVPPWLVYQQLRAINPSPYMFYLALPEQILIGASPEMQVKVEKSRIKSRPIAGTRKITGQEVVDSKLRKELLADEKERAEHLMLVDLSRNDIGRVSNPASVEVREFMILEAYSHVVHIVSTVEGEIKPELDNLAAFAACFPAGTLSGAPKRKAMEIIAELERDPRGPYGGSVGFVDFNGMLDSCITIRSILYRKGSYYLQSGAGIVADSIPEREDEETYHKARVLMVAIKEAERIHAADD